MVLSTQHSPDIADVDLHEAVMDEIIKPVLPEEWLSKQTRYFINPTGRFVIGGPMGDCGVTGRKIIVDTYGGMARHGGGAFSGKDPSKVDRSAAYACRYIAKNIVAAGLAERCEIQVSYAIGVAEPTSIMVDTFGTGQIGDGQLIGLIREHFDLRPRGMLYRNRRLWPLWPRRGPLHLGTHRQGRNPEKGRRCLSPDLNLPSHAAFFHLRNLPYPSNTLICHPPPLSPRSAATGPGSARLGEGQPPTTALTQTNPGADQHE